MLKEVLTVDGQEMIKKQQWIMQELVITIVIAKDMEA
jgi:hypothetical protein